MGGSDSPTLDVALPDFIVAMGRAKAARRYVDVPAIGVLWYMPSPADGPSLWGCVDRQSRTCGPLVAAIEVAGESEPNLTQIAHYVHARRLARRYAQQCVHTLSGLVSAAAGWQIACQADEFTLDSIRIPPRPWDGEVWKMRWRHAKAAGRVLELEFVELEAHAAHIYGVGPEATALPH